MIEVLLTWVNILGHVKMDDSAQLARKRFWKI